MNAETGEISLRSLIFLQIPSKQLIQGIQQPRNQDKRNQSNTTVNRRIDSSNSISFLSSSSNSKAPTGTKTVQTTNILLINPRNDRIRYPTLIARWLVISSYEDHLRHRILKPYSNLEETQTTLALTVPVVSLRMAIPIIVFYQINHSNSNNHIRIILKD